GSGAHGYGDHRGLVYGKTQRAGAPVRLSEKRNGSRRPRTRKCARDRSIALRLGRRPAGTGKVAWGCLGKNQTSLPAPHAGATPGCPTSGAERASVAFSRARAISHATGLW